MRVRYWGKKEERREKGREFGWRSSRVHAAVSPESRAPSPLSLNILIMTFFRIGIK